MTHSGSTIANFVYENVRRSGIVLHTDELPAYRWIGRKLRRHRPGPGTASLLALLWQITREQ